MNVVDEIKNFLSINKNICLLKSDTIGFHILKNIAEKLTNNTLYLCDDYESVFEICELYNAVSVNSLSREDIKLFRLFHKRTAGNMDLYPFGDLFLDQLIELGQKLNLEAEEFAIDYKRIPKETSIGYLDIKKYDLLDSDINIISNDELPFNYKKWFTFTIKQKEQIVFLHNREKVTRHKAIHPQRILRFE